MSGDEIGRVLRENMELKRQMRKLLEITPVLCAECGFCNQWQGVLYYCSVHKRHTDPDRYCSEGVRK